MLEKENEERVTAERQKEYPYSADRQRYQTVGKFSKSTEKNAIVKCLGNGKFQGTNPAFFNIQFFKLFSQKTAAQFFVFAVIGGEKAADGAVPYHAVNPYSDLIKERQDKT